MRTKLPYAPASHTAADVPRSWKECPLHVKEDKPCIHPGVLQNHHHRVPVPPAEPPELGALQQLFTISDTFPGTPSRGCSVSNEAVPSTRLKRTCKQIKGENADRITRALTTYTTVTGCRVGHGGGPSSRAPRQGTNQEGRGAVLAKNVYALPGLNCINQIQLSGRTAGS